MTPVRRQQHPAELELVAPLHRAWDEADEARGVAGLANDQGVHLGDLDEPIERGLRLLSRCRLRRVEAGTRVAVHHEHGPRNEVVSRERPEGQSFGLDHDATVAYASSTMPAISSQSTSPCSSTPSHPRWPTYGGRKNFSGSMPARSSCAPPGAAHQIASRPSSWWLSMNIRKQRFSR